MLEKEQYSEIARKYGHYASWALWADVGEKPKSNIGDISMFDLNNNPNILEQLNPNVIMCGLNISRKIENTFGNFHDGRPEAQDYKIRYAFKNTKYYGAYMTDIIKDFEQVVSGTVITYLKKNSDFEKQNIAVFEQELRDLKSLNPLIIAFGNHSFSILEKYFKERYQIVKVPHYSMQISKEDYKALVDKLTEND